MNSKPKSQPTQSYPINVFLFILALVQITALVLVVRYLASKNSLASQESPPNQESLQDNKNMNRAVMPSGVTDKRKLQRSDTIGIVQISLAFLAVAFAASVLVFTPASSPFLRFVGILLIALAQYGVYLSLQEATDLMGWSSLKLFDPTWVFGIVWYGTMAISLVLFGMSAGTLVSTQIPALAVCRRGPCLSELKQ
ncbi:MAG: hypothetical protein HYZ49_11095 [Chloroflexi bacterium]|nr:hypothetical protein [Chloroflexota bacterium]